MADHGASTIKQWMNEFVELARSGRDFDISAGAEPGREYAYLEFHPSGDEHTILVFNVEETDEGPKVRAHRFEGTAEAVREEVSKLTHGE